MSTNEVMGASSGARKRNRSRPEALKREIVAAALAPGSSVSKAARRYDVNASQLFAWRKRFCDEAKAPPAEGYFDLQSAMVPDALDAARAATNAAPALT